MIRQKGWELLGGWPWFQRKSKVWNQGNLCGDFLDDLVEASVPRRIKSVEPVELVEPGKSLWQFLQMTSYRPQPQRKSTVWNLWNHFENSAKSWQFGWGLASSKENQKCGTCGTCGAREISMAISWMTWLRPAMATKKIKSVEPVEPVEPG